MNPWDELFGSTPRSMPRPDHPDFERLIQVVWSHDISLDETEEADKERVWAETVEKYADVRSVNYTAIQRFLRAFGRPSTAEEVHRMAILASLWVDGFCAGAGFEREGGHRDADAAGDDKA